MKKSLLIIFIFLYIFSFAQKDSTIVSGIVLVKSNKEPVAFATVHVDNYTLHAITNLDGKFQFKVPRNIFKHKIVLITNYVGYLFDTLHLTKVTETKDLIIFGYNNSISYGDDFPLQYQEPLIDPNFDNGTVKREIYNESIIIEYYNKKGKLTKSINQTPNYIPGNGIKNIYRYNSDSLIFEHDYICDYRVDTTFYQYHERYKYDKRKNCIDYLSYNVHGNKKTVKTKFGSKKQVLETEESIYDPNTQILKTTKKIFLYRKNEFQYYDVKETSSEEKVIVK